MAAALEYGAGATFPAPEHALAHAVDVANILGLRGVKVELGSGVLRQLPDDTYGYTFWGAEVDD